MSIQETISKEGDPRHKADDKLPASLGVNPSEDTLKSWFSNYGWVQICELKNNTSHTVTFYNPYNDDARGDILPGETEAVKSKGYLPLEEYSKRYTIKCYNTVFNEWTTISIKDLDHDWLITFEQPNVDDDIREFRPYQWLDWARISLIINDNGYRIYGCDYKADVSRLSFRQRH